MSDFTNSFCVVRSKSAGIWVGYLKDYSGHGVILATAKRVKPLWKCGIDSIAVDGKVHDDSKSSVAVDLVRLRDVREIILCSPFASDQLQSW